LLKLWQAPKSWGGYGEACVRQQVPVVGLPWLYASRRYLIPLVRVASAPEPGRGRACIAGRAPPSMRWCWPRPGRAHKQPSPHVATCASMRRTLGPLANARLTEAFALMWIKMALQQGFGREYAFGMIRG
jgi:hypothetical protein